jgi:hypothetical protein
MVHVSPSASASGDCAGGPIRLPVTSGTGWDALGPAHPAAPRAIPPSCPGPTAPVLAAHASMAHGARSRA